MVDPPGECWPDTKVINELAKRLGLDDFWEEDHEALDAWLAPSGLSFEDLKHHRTLLPKKAYSNANLRTPSGKVEIVAKSLADIGLSVLPTWREFSADTGNTGRISLCFSRTRNPRSLSVRATRVCLHSERCGPSQ